MNILYLLFIKITFIYCNDDKQGIKKKWLSNLIFWRAKNSLNCVKINSSKFNMDLPENLNKNSETVEELIIYSEPFDKISDEIYTEIKCVQENIKIPHYENINDIKNIIHKENYSIIDMSSNIDNNILEISNKKSISNNSILKLESINDVNKEENKRKVYPTSTKNLKGTLQFICNTNEVKFSNPLGHDVKKFTLNKKKLKNEKDQCLNIKKSDFNKKENLLVKGFISELPKDFLDLSLVSNTKNCNSSKNLGIKKSKTFKSNKITYDCCELSEEDLENNASKIIKTSRSFNDATVDIFNPDMNFFLFCSSTSNHQLSKNDNSDELNSSEKIYEDFKHKNLGELVKYIKSLNEKK